MTLTAQVTCAGDPSGGLLGVTFWDGGDILEETVPVTSDGAAVHKEKLSTVGTHTITAAYNGNANCGASHAETTVVMSEAQVPPTIPDELCWRPQQHSHPHWAQPHQEACWPDRHWHPYWAQPHREYVS